MLKIQFGGTVDPLERLLTNLIADWDEIERWAIRNGHTDERLTIAKDEKDKLLARIAMMREAAKAG